MAKKEEETLLSNFDMTDLGVHYIFGEIDEKISLKTIQFIHRFEYIYPDMKELHIYLNSYGGTLTDTWGIVDAIKRCKIKIIVHAVGAVMSGGTMILLCADKRYMDKHCTFMAHQFSDGKEGKHHELKAARIWEDICHEQMVEFYTEHSKLTRKRVEKLLLCSNDTYLLPEECLKYGLIDEIE